VVSLVWLSCLEGPLTDYPCGCIRLKGGPLYSGTINLDYAGDQKNRAIDFSKRFRVSDHCDEDDRYNR
jgi:hypothetical protein